MQLTASDSIEQGGIRFHQPGSRIELVFHWKGGIHSSESVAKFAAGKHASDTSLDVVEAIRIMARICSDKTIAAYLTRGGIEPPTGKHWTWKKVAGIRNYREIPPASKHPSGVWLNLGAAAKRIGINRNVLARAATRGLIHAEHPLANGPWVFSGEALSKQSLTKLRSRLQAGLREDAHADSEQLNLAISTTSEKEAE